MGRDDDRASATIDEFVERFESAWSFKPRPALPDFVPPSGEPLRRQILCELVKVDQELRWRAGERKRLESYLTEWPELSEDQQALAELIHAECLTRALIDGAPPSQTDLASRFSDLQFPIDIEGIASAVGRYDRSRPIVIDTDTPGKPTDDGSTTPALLTSPPDPFQSGSRLGRFQIRGLLGRGGMATVYQAFDMQLERDIALKIPHLDLSVVPEVSERFVEEARLAAKVDHPNVCPVFDAGEEDGTYYIAMKLVRGCSLAQRLEQGPLSPREAAESVAKVAAGLGTLHTRGILHRDIKPSNVLIEDSGEYLLTDFGLAKPTWPAAVSARRPAPLADQAIASDAATRELDEGKHKHEHRCWSQTGAFAGTLPYMAPELLCGVPATERSDVYSLGVLLYEALTGQRPFQGGPDEIVEGIFEGQFLPPRQLRHEISPGLEAVCLKAMASNPAMRFASAEELGEALRGCILIHKRRPWSYFWRGAVLLSTLLLIVLLILQTARSGKGVVTVTGQHAGLGLLLDGAPIDTDFPSKPIPISVGEHRLEVSCEGRVVAHRVFRVPWRGAKVSVPAPVSGWGLPRFDLYGTRCYPFPSKRLEGPLNFVKTWSVNGDTVFTGDIDNDGRLELIVTENASLRVYNGNGRLRWQRDGAGTLNLVVDVTGDGIPDILVSYGSGDRIGLRVYDGAGVLLEDASTRGSVAQLRPGFNRKATIWASAVADVQGDGDYEVIAYKHSEGGDSARGPIAFDLRTGEELWHHSIGPTVRDMAVGDTTFTAGLEILHATGGPCNGVRGGDGTTDDKGYVFCLEGVKGTVLWSRVFDHHGFVNSTVALSDLDGDQRLDIIASSYQHDGLSSWGGLAGRLYLLDRDTGATIPGFERDFGTTVNVGGIADFDADGAKEVLVSIEDARRHAGRLALLNATAGFPVRVQFDLPGAYLDPHAVNDLDGDGHPEIIAVAGLRNTKLKSDQLMVFDWQLHLVWAGAPGSVIDQVVVSDLNGDGVNELVLHQGGRVAVYAVSGPGEN